MADAYKMWQQSEIGAHVHSYIAAGMAVFPCHGMRDGKCTCGLADCRNAGKHPACRNGLLDAVTDFDLAADLFQFRIDLNIGIACGEKSKLAIIDIDPAKGGDESLKKLEAVLGTLPKCPTVLTGGDGRHLVFNHPTERLPNRSDAFGKEYPGIDIRNDGGYVVWPPSMHKSGKRYRFDDGFFGIDFPDMPDSWKVLGAAAHNSKKDQNVDRHSKSGEQSDWTPEDMQGALDYLSPDMTYNDWIAIGMALHRDGFELDLWDRWSARGTKYKGIADLNIHWRSFNRSGERTIGTIIEWATLQGWKPERRHEPRIVSEQAENIVAPLLKKIATKNQPQKKDPDIKESSKKPSVPVFSPKFNFDSATLTGPIGDTVRWIVRHAIYEQPELALLNTVAFAGAVFGRRYASPVNTRTNIYMVGIARTGGGKEHSCGMIAKLALESMLINFVGANGVRSDIGILKSLVVNSTQLMMLDEFGMLMQALSNDRADYTKKAIISVITKIYSKSNSAYNHGDVGDPRALPITLSAPNLCIYGTTTEESYVPSLKRIAIVNGELNRFIVIPSRTKVRPKRAVPIVEDNKELFDWWKRFSPRIGQSTSVLMNSAGTAPVPKIVEWGECEDLQYKILEEQTEICESDHATRYLWGRLYENTIKVAMIFAIARDPMNPVFEKIDFDYAYNIVTVSIKYMESLAENGMAETPQEAGHLEIMNAIKDAGTISRSDLLRKFRKFRKRELDDVLGTLVEEDAIMIERITPAGGRPKVVYHYLHGAEHIAA